MINSETLLLSRQDIVSLMTFDDYFKAAEDAFRLHAEGKTIATGLLHADSQEGEYHIKTGGLYLDRAFFGLKANGGFFRNPERNGLPAIQGIIYLSDAATGYPLAILDSVEITRQRTAATTALAAKHLAKPESAVITICGTGAQARSHLRAFAKTFPLQQGFVFSRNAEKGSDFAATMSAELELPVALVSDLRGATESDIILTCTTAREAFLLPSMVSSGTFVGAIGADSPQKHEIAPELLARSRVVPDLVQQCAEVGELHHAIAAGAMTSDQIHGELGEIILKKKPGRTDVNETFVFDSTGTALQDVAAAACVYEKAASAGRGTMFDFSGDR